MPRIRGAYIGLVRGVDPVLAEVPQRAVEAEKTLFAVLRLGGTIVHVMTKLDVGIERAGRPAPAECNMRSELGRDHVAHNAGVGVEPVRREWGELILPSADDSAPFAFRAQRDRAVSLRRRSGRRSRARRRGRIPYRPPTARRTVARASQKLSPSSAPRPGATPNSSR